MPSCSVSGDVVGSDWYICIENLQECNSAKENKCTGLHMGLKHNEQLWNAPGDFPEQWTSILSGPTIKERNSSDLHANVN